MPELPEVEVVRRGLARGVVGRRLAGVDVHHPRAVRRHEAGAQDLVSRLTGATLQAASRRGKYLWLRTGPDALVGHLGMSGQLLVVPPEKPAETHLRVRMTFTDAGRELRFVDQRTFGGLALQPLVDDGAGGSLPASIAHIARDPLDPLFDDEVFVDRLRTRRSEVKRALLDQTLVSGIGNIYADEALWRAGLHGARPSDALTRAKAQGLLGHARDVMQESLAQGGTSFDALYVSTEGVSGYFQRSLQAYGREGEPCGRCGTPLRRQSFMNRSSFSCPRCQPAPRARTRPVQR
jgi:formamidopyrimidine-DNA glycosylase